MPGGFGQSSIFFEVSVFNKTLKIEIGAFLNGVAKKWSESLPEFLPAVNIVLSKPILFFRAIP
jgi:hypothetical protein